MQYRSPVGAGPSWKTCPRCASQRLQCTSVRRMKKLRSSCSPTISESSGRVKEGQPVPLSNLSACAKSGAPQQTQEKVPGPLGKSSWVKARSVPCRRVTL